jgi:hypothetical protein
MSDIYCGIGKPPKGKQLGTMRQCAEHGQVRLYGIKKIDPKTLDLVKQKGIMPESQDKLRLLVAELRGTIRRNKGRYETTKDTAAKNEYYKVWQKAEKELEKAIAKYKAIELAKKKIDDKTESIGSTKKSGSLAKKTGSLAKKVGSTKKTGSLAKKVGSAVKVTVLKSKVSQSKSKNVTSNGKKTGSKTKKASSK